ncbi:hypothetical protein HK100_002221 [Physocladia obscura]|uniref:Uncharacterized protein n=1 Tax=Physocladia obscura TaxID=109957 RepID=A0AAD5SYU2_9FUNG|nr:hypothetical protein HK100_002221 [Physocladia obscura]
MRKLTRPRNKSRTRNGSPEAGGGDDFDGNTSGGSSESGLRKLKLGKKKQTAKKKKNPDELEISGPIIDENTPVPKGAIPLGRLRSAASVVSGDGDGSDNDSSGNDTSNRNQRQQQLKMQQQRRPSNASNGSASDLPSEKNRSRSRSRSKTRRDLSDSEPDPPPVPSIPKPSGRPARKASAADSDVSDAFAAAAAARRKNSNEEILQTKRKDSASNSNSTKSPAPPARQVSANQNNQAKKKSYADDSDDETDDDFITVPVSNKKPQKISPSQNTGDSSNESRGDTREIAPKKSAQPPSKWQQAVQNKPVYVSPSPPPPNVSSKKQQLRISIQNSSYYSEDELLDDVPAEKKLPKQNNSRDAKSPNSRSNKSPPPAPFSKSSQIKGPSPKSPKSPNIRMKPERPNFLDQSSDEEDTFAKVQKSANQSQRQQSNQSRRNSDLSDINSEESEGEKALAAKSFKSRVSNEEKRKRLSALDASKTGWAKKKPGQPRKIRESVLNIDEDDGETAPSSSALNKLEGKTGARRGSVKRNSSDLEVWVDMDQKLAEKKAAVEKQRLKLKQQKEEQERLEKEREQQEILERQIEQQQMLEREREQQQKRLDREREQQEKIERDREAADALALALDIGPRDASLEVKNSPSPRSASLDYGDSRRQENGADSPNSSSRRRLPPRRLDGSGDPNNAKSPLQETGSRASSFLDYDELEAPSKNFERRRSESASPSQRRKLPTRQQIEDSKSPLKQSVSANARSGRNPRLSSLSLKSRDSTLIIVPPPPQELFSESKAQAPPLKVKQLSQKSKSKKSPIESQKTIPAQETDSEDEPTRTPAPFVPVIKKFNWASAAKKLEATTAEPEPVPLQEEPPESDLSEKEDTSTQPAATGGGESKTQKQRPPRSKSLTTRSTATSDKNTAPNPESSQAPNQEDLSPPPQQEPPKKALSAKERSQNSSAKAKKVVVSFMSMPAPIVIPQPAVSTKTFNKVSSVLASPATTPAERQKKQSEMWKALELELNASDNDDDDDGDGTRGMFADLERQASLLNTANDHRRKSRMAFSKVASLAAPPPAVKKSVVDDDMWAMLEAETLELNNNLANRAHVGPVSPEERLRRMEERALRKLGKLEEKGKDIAIKVKEFDEKMKRQELGEEKKEVKPSILAGLFGSGSKRKDSTTDTTSGNIAAVAKATLISNNSIQIPPTMSPSPSIKSNKSAEEDKSPTASQANRQKPTTGNSNAATATSPITVQSNSGLQIEDQTDGSPKPAGFLARLLNRSEKKENESPVLATAASSAASSPTVASASSPTKSTAPANGGGIGSMAQEVAANAKSLKPSSSQLKTSAKPGGSSYNQSIEEKNAPLTVPQQSGDKKAVSITKSQPVDKKNMNVPAEKTVVFDSQTGEKTTTITPSTSPTVTSPNIATATAAAGTAASITFTANTAVPKTDPAASTEKVEKKTVLGWLFGGKKEDSKKDDIETSKSSTAETQSASTPTPAMARQISATSDAESVTSKSSVAVAAAERSAERRKKWAEMKADGGATNVSGMSIEERRQQWMARKQSDAGIDVQNLAVRSVNSSMGDDKKKSTKRS